MFDYKTLALGVLLLVTGVVTGQSGLVSQGAHALIFSAERAFSEEPETNPAAVERGGK